MLGGAPESGKGHHSEVRGGLGELRAEESPDGQWSTPGRDVPEGTERT